MPLSLLWVAYLPAILKFLWAPLADRYWFPALGRRRTWLILSTFGLAGVAFFLVSLTASPPR